MVKKIIGRSKDCDYIIYDPKNRVSRLHLEISYNGKFYTLDDMSNKSFYKSPPELIVFRIPIKSNINKSYIF